MVTVNHNYLKLPGSYLFSTIGKKVRAYKEENPDKEVISLGIGDVTQPLVPAIIDAPVSYTHLSAAWLPDVRFTTWCRRQMIWYLPETGNRRFFV